MTHLEKTEASTSKKPSTQKLFNKPHKWSFAMLKLLIILILLLSNAPDIQLDFYTVNILF